MEVVYPLTYGSDGEVSGKTDSDGVTSSCLQFMALNVRQKGLWIRGRRVDTDEVVGVSISVTTTPRPTAKNVDSTRSVVPRIVSLMLTK